jgi:hypothetical protein
MLGRPPLGIAAGRPPLELDEPLDLLPDVHLIPWRGSTRVSGRLSAIQDSLVRRAPSAAGGTRTHKRLRAADFESASFANLDTAACGRF